MDPEPQVKFKLTEPQIDTALLMALLDRLRGLLVNSAASEDIRVWIAGDSTGTTAYICAILLHDLAMHLGKTGDVKIFATHADPSIVAMARNTYVPAASLQSLSPTQRLNFLYIRSNQHYVSELIRDSVIFAPHALLSNPPFSRLHLLICRESVASLNAEQQMLALDRFFFALRPGGLLLLETELAPDQIAGRFQPDQLHRQLYTRLNLFSSQQNPLLPAASAAMRALRQLELFVDLGPQPGLLVDRQGRIVYFGKGVHRFLQLKSKEIAPELLAVVHPELRASLQLTLQRALSRNRAAESQPVQMSIAGTFQQVTVVVQQLPVSTSATDYLLVTFDSFLISEDLDIYSNEIVVQLELLAQFDQLQAEHLRLMAQYDLANQELLTSNEDLRVLNEELRSTAEELEVRREELQTLNEELVMVNQDLEHKVAELSRVNADLQNLMVSSDIATLFLDRELYIKRFTPQLQELFNLIASDLNRPLTHITHQLIYAELLDDAKQLLATLAPFEREVQHVDGRWLLVRLRPYLIQEQRVDGVVLTFLDITESKVVEHALRESRDTLEQRVLERTAELVQAHAARRALIREMLQTQEAERLRIARELHDQVGQQITAILLGLQMAKEQVSGQLKTLEQLEYVREIVHTMSQEMHAIATALRPTTLDDMGLAEALRSYAESWSRRSGVTVELFVTGLEHKAVPAEIETTIYRVVLEALTNVVRHAEATQVNLILERHGMTLVAMIEDNGHGFDVEALSHAPQRGVHLGLLGMHERAALIGGTLTIESEIGGGTTVIVRVPLQGGLRDGTNPDYPRR